MGETQSRPVTLDKRHRGTDLQQRRRQPQTHEPSDGSSYNTPRLFPANKKVFCADDPPPPPLPTADSAPPPPSLDAGDRSADTAIAKAAQEASRFPNPGTHEMVLNEGKRYVMLDTFDGFRCDINKQVSPFMMALHSFQLGSSMLPDGKKNNYTFTTQVADDNGAFMARVDPARSSVEFRVHKGLLGGLAMGKVQGLATREGTNDQVIAEIDAGAMTWSGNLKYGSMGGGNMFGLGFMQTVHPNVIMGAEGMYLAANSRYISSYLMRVNWTAAATAKNLATTESATKSAPLSPGMPPPEGPGHSVLCLNYNSAAGAVTANYKQTIAPNRLTLGADIQFSPISLESQLLLGAEFKWQRSKLSVCYDGTGRIQSVLESKIGMTPASPSLLLSADVDHWNDTMRFGYGLTIDS